MNKLDNKYRFNFVKYTTTYNSLKTKIVSRIGSCKGYQLFEGIYNYEM